jgi:DmsE family decaheme c-type cytochrome
MQGGCLTAAVLWCVCVVVWPLSAAAKSEEVCFDCHEETVIAFNGSFHGRVWVGTDNEEDGCESCHGSADVHQEDNTKETIITFGPASLQTPDEQSQRCLACHKKSTNLTFWEMGAHQSNAVGCVTCHSIHQARSTVAQPTICFNCHRDVRADANKISHHPIVEGKVSCTDCHNPHGTLYKHMVKAESTNQLCTTCHADKRGPWIWEHPPVEEDCAICHTPHGSRHETLLVERVTTLCRDCHTANHSHVTDNQLTFTNDQNNSKRDLGRGCIECHHAIHGSSHFYRSLTH